MPHDIWHCERAPRHRWQWVRAVCFISVTQSIVALTKQHLNLSLSSLLCFAHIASYGKPILQRELGIIATACLYGHLRPQSIHLLEEYMASIWLFAAIYLFTSIGANIDEMAFASIQGA